MNSTEGQELRDEIVATRAELAQTADALAAKLDAQAQVGKKVAAAVAGAALLVLLVNRLRARSSRQAPS